MTPTVTESVLVYDRIASNRRKTILLVAVAILSIVPFVGLLSYGVADWTLAQFGHRNVSRSEYDRIRLELARPPGSIRTEYDSAMDRQLAADFSRMEQTRDDYNQLRWKFTLVFACGVTAILGLLFWSLASSPTSQVLAMCGARPAGPAETEAKRLLENLSIGAGLPVPKLYVIDSPVPNAFAAGMDPAHSVVAVTHGLLALLDHRELEGVLAHEISHIGNRDTRLNTVVTAIALFLRLPYLMWQRRRKQRQQADSMATSWTPVRPRFRIYYTVAMLPIFVYVFFIAPLLAAIIRAAISRSREYQADADAALLTRYPEGLLRALAKIRGAGSAVAGSNTVISHLYFADPATAGALMSFFRGNLLATHPPIEDRINRLMEFNGGVTVSVLEAAARTGAGFSRDHPVLNTPGTGDTMAQDELAVLTTGTPMGRVFRVLSDTTLYDRPDLKSQPVARVAAGALIVIFDDPGKFRQVLTHDQTFGYMPSAVKTQRVDMLPSEIHDPVARAAAQQALGPVGMPATPARTALEKTAQVSATVVAQATSPSKLTTSQLAIAAAVFIVLFMGIFLVLLRFGS